MGSSGTTSTFEIVKQDAWRSFSGLAKLLVLGEALIISFLSFWLYEESLANRYMALYVNETLQAEGLTIGALAFVLVLLTGVTSMLFFKGKGSRKTGGAVSTTFKIPIPTITSNPRLESASVGGTPSPDFHPIVAALKAGLSVDPFAFMPTPVPETVPGKEEATVARKEQEAIPAVTPSSSVVDTTLQSVTEIVAIPTSTKAESSDPVVKKVETERKLDVYEKAEEKTSTK